MKMLLLAPVRGTPGQNVNLSSCRSSQTRYLWIILIVFFELPVSATVLLLDLQSKKLGCYVSTLYVKIPLLRMPGLHGVFHPFVLGVSKSVTGGCP